MPVLISNNADSGALTFNADDMTDTAVLVQTVGADKMRVFGNGIVSRLVTRSTIANAATITDAQLEGQVLYQDASGGNVTMTTRTGTQTAAYFAGMGIGNSFPIFLASNHASNTSTIAGGVDVTLVGSGAVINTGGVFLLIKTAATTFDLVRVG